MSLSVISITLNIRNNRSYPQRINVLGSPVNPLDTANAKTEYRWDVTSLFLTASEYLVLEYKPAGATTFSLYTVSEILNPNIESIIAALNNLGIGYFNYYTELGQNYISTNNDEYVFGTLTINSNIPTTTTTTSTTSTSTSTTSTSTSTSTSSTTTTTTAAPTTTSTTTTTTAAPVPTTTSTTTTTTAAPTSTTTTTSTTSTTTTAVGAICLGYDASDPLLACQDFANCLV